MTAIWFILAGMTAAAVLGLLWPMSRRASDPTREEAEAGVATETAFYEDQLSEIERDQERGLIAPEEAESARAEAARRLLRASREETKAGDPLRLAEPRLRRRRAASAFALSTIPLVALIAYGLYGSPELPAQTEADRVAARGGNDELTKAVGQIESRLARNPDDLRGWQVLAPVYMRTGRFDDAARAYGQIARLNGGSAESLSDQGEALTAAGDGTVSPQAKALFVQALEKDPRSPKARFYVARAAEQSGDTQEAIAQLTTLEAGSPADAPWLGAVRATLARLKGEPAPPSAQAPATRAIPADQQAAIRGMVDGLDTRLKGGGGTPDEWVRLIRSRTVLGERDQALAALSRAGRRWPAIRRGSPMWRRAPGSWASGKLPLRRGRRVTPPPIAARTGRPRCRRCARCRRRSATPRSGAWSTPSTGASWPKAAPPTSGCGLSARTACSESGTRP